MKRYWKLMLFIVVYGAACALMFFEEGSFLYVMLLWNVILATIPLILMHKAIESQGNVKKTVLIILWILFLPNALYMVTDFIHITNHAMIWTVPVEPYEGLSGTRYTMDAVLWSKLLIISMGAFYALLTGLESLNEFYKLVLDFRGRLAAAFMIFITLLLSSFGIYIGRFLRFNSWDIIRPIILLENIIAEASRFTMTFVTIYTAFSLAAFLIYRSFRQGSFGTDIGKIKK